MTRVGPRNASSEPREGEISWSIDSAENPRVVIILLGWFAAVDRHVAKYADLYTARLPHCAVVRTTAPKKDVFYKQSRLLTLAQRLQSEIALKHPGTPLIVHTFSNGGCFLYRAICSTLSGSTAYPRSQDIAGVIFDSCPADLQPSKGALALSHVATNRAARALFFGIAFCVLWLWSLLSCGKNRQQYIDWFKQQSVDRPELYLYSSAYSTASPAATPDPQPPTRLTLNMQLLCRGRACAGADNITDATVIDSLVAHRRGQGAAAEARRWSDSGHVSHMRRHPDEYSDLCMAFVRRAVPRSAM